MPGTEALDHETCRDCGGKHASGSAVCPLRTVPHAPSLVGRLVGGRYRVVDKIAEGGMAAVFEAVNESVGKRVALKILLSNLLYSEHAVRRFYQEARTVAALGHENLVEVHDLGLTDEGVPFMVMELLSGTDLGSMLSAGERFDVGRAVWVVSQVLAGLDAAHRAGVVHRDLKPENVVITTKPGSGEVVKVLDFGVALVRCEEGSPRLTGELTVLGTAQYMAPEQIVDAGGVDHRADIHAAGALLYELLAGRPPFLPGPDWRETLRRVLEDSPTPLAELAPHVPPELCATVHRALDKSPEGRFASAADMLDAIAPFMQWRSTAVARLPPVVAARIEAASTVAFEETPQPAAAGEPRPPARRRPLPFVVTAVTAALLAGGLALALRGREAPPAARIAEVEPPVEIALDIEPADATLFLDGSRLGPNPGAIRLPRDTTHVLRAEAPGYAPAEVAFRALEDARVTLALSQEAEPAAHGARARPRGTARPRVIEKNPYR